MTVTWKRTSVALPATTEKKMNTSAFPKFERKTLANNISVFPCQLIFERFWTIWNVALWILLSTPGILCNQFWPVHFQLYLGKLWNTLHCLTHVLEHFLANYGSCNFDDYCLNCLDRWKMEEFFEQFRLFWTNDGSDMEIHSLHKKRKWTLQHFQNLIGKLLTVQRWL